MWFIDTVRFHTTLRCRKELFMLYKDCTSTGESLYFLYFREKKWSMLIQPKEEKQRKYRQSDGFILLMNVGNATGGKGATYGNNQEVTCAILRDWKSKKTTFEEKSAEYTEI